MGLRRHCMRHFLARHALLAAIFIMAISGPAAAARDSKIADAALLAAGAAIEAKHATTAQTALMWAIAEHHLDATRVLLEHGAAVGARTKDGFTPLLFAAREGDFETTRLLLGKGADINESS